MNVKLLERLRGSSELVDIRRSGLDVADLRGSVLAATPAHVLLELASDDILPKGYAVVRTGDISFMRWGTVRLAAWARSLPKVEPDERAMALDAFKAGAGNGLAGIVESLVVTTPWLLTFHPEAIDPTVCYIGKDVSVEDSTVKGRGVSAEGVLDGHFALRIDDITTVEFGGPYEKGLARMLASASQ